MHQLCRSLILHSPPTWATPLSLNSSFDSSRLYDIAEVESFNHRCGFNQRYHHRILFIYHLPLLNFFTVSITKGSKTIDIMEVSKQFSLLLLFSSILSNLHLIFLSKNKLQHQAFWEEVDALYCPKNIKDSISTRQILNDYPSCLLLSQMLVSARFQAKLELQRLAKIEVLGLNSFLEMYSS